MTGAIAPFAAAPMAGLVFGAPGLGRPSSPEGDPLGGCPVPPTILGVLRRRQGQGSPLPAAVSTAMGEQLGADLTGVGIHADAEAGTIARSLQSRAFTFGSDVYFSAGAYAPTGGSGQELLAHELAHVAQGSPASGGAPVIGRTDDPAEKSADAAAHSAIARLRRSMAEHLRSGDGAAPAPVRRAAVRRLVVRRNFAKELAVGSDGRIFYSHPSGRYALVSWPVHPQLGPLLCLSRDDGFMVWVDATTLAPVFPDDSMEAHQRAVLAGIEEHEAPEGAYENDGELAGMDVEAKKPDYVHVDTDMEEELEAATWAVSETPEKKPRIANTQEGLAQKAEAYAQSKTNNGLVVQIGLAPDGPGQGDGEPLFRSASLWIESLRMGDKDRPDGRFGNQKSHTVAWTLVRAEMASFNGRPLANLLTHIKQGYGELRALSNKLKSDQQATTEQQHKAKAVERLSAGLLELETLATALYGADTTLRLHVWQGLSARLVRAYIEAYQLSKGTTMSAGKADGHGEGTAMATLRDYEQQCAVGALAALPGDAPTAAAKLLDVNLGLSLGVDGVGFAVHHWTKALHAAFPTLMKAHGAAIVADIMKRVVSPGAAKQLLLGPGATYTDLLAALGHQIDHEGLARASAMPARKLTASHPGALRLPIPDALSTAFTVLADVEPDNVAEGAAATITSSFATDGVQGPDVAVPTSAYRSSQMLLRRVALSDVDRPDTRWGTAQMSHTVAWTLVRAHIRSFAGKPLPELIGFLDTALTELLGHLDSEATALATSARQRIAAATDLTAAHPTHSWQTFAEDLLRAYAVVHQKSRSAVYADASSGGSHPGHGEGPHMKTLRDTEAQLQSNRPTTRTPESVANAAAALLDIHEGDATLTKAAAKSAYKHWKKALAESFPAIMNAIGAKIESTARDTGKPGRTLGEWLDSTD